MTSQALLPSPPPALLIRRFGGQASERAAELFKTDSRAWVREFESKDLTASLMKYTAV
jgi:hypothetical protein